MKKKITIGAIAVLLTVAGLIASNESDSQYVVSFQNNEGLLRSAVVSEKPETDSFLYVEEVTEDLDTIRVLKKNLNQNDSISALIVVDSVKVVSVDKR